ncbi:SusD/RagB family nutrient-binding outer membrane lipoprotein [Croceiramulus getboli]|nr:SusD/RagB family nutrient-binding outer membrane lipoprotein [Flavobacteriaceae bacterium YJPT1-3]
MKSLFKYLLILAVGSSVFYSCETTELDLLVTPNDLAVDQADANLLLNSTQLAYITNQEVLSDLGAEVVRIDYMFGLIYFNNYPGNTMSGSWARAYSSAGTPAVGMFTNIAAIEAINAESGGDFDFHLGIGKALQAHTLLQLTDYIGEATWSEALNPAEFPAPNLDSGEEIYATALGLLDEAEALLSGSNLIAPDNDLFYAGDTSKWIKMINTVRLKAYQTTGNLAAFDQIIAGGNFISSIDDDFQFNYGTNVLNPDNRHPDYAADYTPSGANIYQSNWLMNYMLEQDDPRLRYYFYRQQDMTPGADAPPNEEVLACSLAIPPDHYTGFVYCSVPNGYWGRSHGNDEGTPPDNFLRTAVGVYPAGGLFDDNTYDRLDLGTGGGGAGIAPILLASYVDFWRADRAMQAGNTTVALDFMMDGIDKSVEKVSSFAAVDANADLSFEPSSSDIVDFKASIESQFVSGDMMAKWNVLSQQYWVTLYGGATEAYNFYRRTGYPTTLAPSWEPEPGPFPRTFLYPANEVITNPSLTQKQTLTEQVFWDTNPAFPAFPPAN